MKYFLILVSLLAFQYSVAQSLPIDFESDITTSDFVDFDGGTGTVIDNPHLDSENSSTKVAQIVRDGGEIWAGSKILLNAKLDFTTNNGISMKVYSTAPIGTIVKFKLEGDGQTERDIPTTKINEWETMTWDFTGSPTLYNEVVFMFDFGNQGDGSATSTFLFDDVQQLFGGTQIELPVTFEEEFVNYTMSDFGGNQSMLSIDPSDENNTVIQVIKTSGAATWAGTTIGTPAGFATDIPLSLTESKMTVRVWSPQANTPIRLKVEDSDDPTHTCETETNTTIGVGWETIEFDFLNQAPGTELLSVGLDKGWTYNMASIFFDFGSEGTSEEEMYYFDDVQFGPLIVNLEKSAYDNYKVYPNPTSDFWTIEDPDGTLQFVEIYNIQGHLVSKYTLDQIKTQVSARQLISGMYIAKLTSTSESRFVKIYKH